MKVIKMLDHMRNMHYEIGDFLGGEEETDTIRSMTIENHILHIYTGNQDFEYPLKGGEWAKFEDGSSIQFETEDDDVADDAGTE